MPLLDPRNAPTSDLPYGSTGRAYLIASTPRTGSTLLARLLSAQPGAGSPKEYLNPMARRDWAYRRNHLVGWLPSTLTPALRLLPWSDATLRDHLHEVRSKRSDGTFGLKLHYHHFRELFESPGRDLRSWLQPLELVLWVQRRDRLAQAISWAKAVQTNQWAAWQPATRRATFSQRAIDHALQQISVGTTGWDRWLSSAGVPVLPVIYEDLVADPRGELNRVLAALGADPARAIRIPTRRQADLQSAQWRTRYHQNTSRDALPLQL